MKINKLFYLFFVASLFIFGCGDDDNDSQDMMSTDDDSGMVVDDSADVLATERDETTTILTGGSLNTWRITQATLSNSSGDIEVSSNFNTTDDEFIFSGNATNGQLEWRQFNAINTQGSDANGALLDYYVAPESYSFQFLPESSTEITSVNGRLSLTVVDENTVTGVLQFDPGIQEGETLSFTLTEKTAEDYAAVPAAGLTFSEAFVYNSNTVQSHAPGMIGSYSDNSLFIVGREDDLNTGNGAPERIVKYNLDNNTSTENLYFQNDFVSKQLHIVNNELIAFGGQYVNTYPLDLSSDPATIAHGKVLSRHGVAVQGDNAFVFGGDLNNVESDKIFNWSIINESLSEQTTMPEMRFGARGTIVNNKLYVAGGTEEFPGVSAKNTIYGYDIASGGFETFTMTQELDYAHVDRFENLVYIAGRIDVRDDMGSVVGRDAMIGVFNTEDNTFTELQTNLTDPSDFHTIQAMCVFNNKMYILYGGFGEDNGNQFLDWSVMTADLN